MNDISDGGKLRVLGLGVVGGLIGTILMDIVMMITFVAVGESWDMFFTMVGERLGGGAVIGIALHNAVGMTGGFVFALLVLKVPTFEISGMKRGLVLGLAVGLFTIPAGCIPLAIWLGESIVIVIAFSALPHIVWGTVLGWTMGYGMLSAKHRT